MKIIDCFTFYNELKLLEYRLNILYNIVDYFIIVEANQTHQGKSKKLYYNENKNRFEKFQDKIIHIVVDLPYIYPNINYKNNKNFQVINYNENGEQWINEAYQRQCILSGLNKIPLDNNDYIIVCDLDEIPDPNTLSDIKKGKYDFDFVKMKQHLYYYNLNSKLRQIWIHPFIMKCKYYLEYTNRHKPIENSIYYDSKNYSSIYNNNNRLFLSELRLTFNNVPTLDNCGWHLSYFGDKYFIENKYKSFSHVEVDSSNLETNFENIPINKNNYLPPLCKLYLPQFINY